MNLSLVKQKKIREIILDKLPEIIEARKLKKEIAETVVSIAKNSLTDDEKYIIEKHPGVISVYDSSSNIRIDGTGFVENDNDSICGYSYYCWSNEYHSNEVFNEVYFNKGYKSNYFDEIFKDCPRLFSYCCKEVLDLVKTEEEKDALKKKVKKFIELIKISEKKMSKVNTIISAKEIGLRDIKEHSPKLYNIIKRAIDFL